MKAGESRNPSIAIEFRERCLDVVRLDALQWWRLMEIRESKGGRTALYSILLVVTPHPTTSVGAGAGGQLIPFSGIGVGVDRGRGVAP